MALSASTVGLIVIMTLYFGIGVLSAAGSIYISKALLTPKLEQIVFALFLIAPYLTRKGGYSSISPVKNFATSRTCNSIQRRYFTL